MTLRTRRLLFLGLLSLPLALATGCDMGAVDDSGGNGGGNGGGGGGGNGGGGGGGGGAEATPLRVDSVRLLDPHTYALGGLDVTNTVNTMLADALSGDEDPVDGLLDFSVVASFSPYDPSAKNVGLAVSFPDCSAPVGSTACTPAAGGMIITGDASASDGGCFTADPGTLGGYQPGVTAPTGRCFSSGPIALNLDFGGIALDLEDVSIAARYGEGSAALTEGILAGFLSEAVADATILPADVPLVGGDPLSSLLSDADKDVGPSNAPGWWFYIEFTASQVTMQ